MTSHEKYMLVQFVDDIQEKISIDFVPGHWVTFDKEKNHLVTPFISKFSAANVQILKNLVKTEGLPLQSWPMHRVSVRGSARSYAEAEKKVKDLETKAYVFSTDSEGHALAKQNEIFKKYKFQGSKSDDRKVEKLFAAAAVDIGNDAIFGEFFDKSGVSIKEKDINDAIAAAINNAKDWGGREDRHTSKK